MKKPLLFLLLPLLILLLSSWGYKGHRIISMNMAPGLPAQLAFLQPSWTNFVTNHASDPDYRRDSDPNEAPRHYIDLENYPEFIQTGRISHDYDSVVLQHGAGWVIDQGILPWATKRAYDSLVGAFRRGDWNGSQQFAADLGHYVADGHMPLHLTNNYNGQMTGQTGIHSRYESKMVSQYESQLVYTADTALPVGDVTEYIFNYIYRNNGYVDSVLQADLYATSVAGGSVTSGAYYQALWEKTGPFTISLFQRVSSALASLVYTAWVEAGSQPFFPNGVPEQQLSGLPRLAAIAPNPVSGKAEVVVEIPLSGTEILLQVCDALGKPIDTLKHGVVDSGSHRFGLDATGWAPGIYLCVLKSGGQTFSMKMLVQ